MAFSIFFSLTIILMISFVVTKKNLHLFEIFFMWMIINLIHHNFLTVIAVNLRMFDFAEHKANYWTLVFFRVFLIPLLIIWYFDSTLSVNPYKKWAWLPVGILILAGVEYLSDVLNVFRHTHWKFWWSFIEWFVIFLLVNYSWIWYRNLLRKEME
jgi:hypothetical protein